MSIDPLADEAGQEGLSPYHFCANDPANHTDPTGLANGQGSENTQAVNSEGQKEDATIGGNSSGGTVSGFIGPGFLAWASAEIGMGPVQTYGVTLTAEVGNTVTTITIPIFPQAVATTGLQTLTVSETVQDLAAITPPMPSEASNPSIGDFVAATTGTFGTIVANGIANTSSQISSTIHSVTSPQFFNTALALGSATVSITMNSLGHALSHFSLADIGLGPLSLTEEGLGAGMGGGEVTPGGGEVGSVVDGGIEIGSKLDYPFGQASGSAHNIDRSTGMLRQLESVGIFNNAEGRSLLNENLQEAYKNSDGILQSNGRSLRESFLMGPNGGLKVESVWEGNRIITIKLFGGK